MGPSTPTSTPEPGPTTTPVVEPDPEPDPQAGTQPDTNADPTSPPTSSVPDPDPTPLIDTSFDNGETGFGENNPFGAPGTTSTSGDSSRDEANEDGEHKREEEPDIAAEQTVRVGDATPVVVTAGSEIDIAPLLEIPDGAQVEYQWTQVGGTEVGIVDGNSSQLRIELPETFIGEELVFEVEVLVNGQRMVQDVTIQLQPVQAESRTEAMAKTLAVRHSSDAAGERFEAHRGVGKVWASLVAFTGAIPTRIRR